MTSLTGPRESDFRWDDVSLIGGQSNIDKAILSAGIHYSTDMASQLTLQVHDPNFSLARDNYFAIGRTIWYRSYTHSQFNRPVEPQFQEDAGSRIWQRFELASATMGPGPAAGPVWTLMLRPKGIQQLKRNRNSESIGGTGSAFIEAAARWAGLDSVVQTTDEAASLWKTEGEVTENAWDVMGRIAGESAEDEKHTRFMLFEVDNVLFFGTQRWLLGQWGMEYNPALEVMPNTAGSKRTGMNYITMPWNWNNSGVGGVFRLLSLPRVTRSDNNPLEVTGSLQLDRFNGRSLRPGMTIFLDIDGTQYFNGYYLINDVSFDHYGTSAVSVSFRSPERIPKDIHQLEVGQRFAVIAPFSSSVDPIFT